ncbi:MAG: hypothetical protein DRQ47_05740 [Gammaproteobacteria bacterium]|nr:MAG: hypothetical protein DRQ47_05740 [Gammaproteobacteria bacterium]
MAKDYAKKTKRHPGASRFGKKKAGKSIPGWVWLIAGLLIGVLGSFISTLDLELNKSEEAAPKIIKKEPPSAKSRYQAVPPDQGSDSDFSFHNELENKVVEVPENLSKQPKPKPSTKQYIMQCGSFRKISSAETLKATIAMSGFTANIKATKAKSGNTWYRVSLGPYTSKRIAERERHQLERNNINSCRIW